MADIFGFGQRPDPFGFGQAPPDPIGFGLPAGSVSPGQLNSFKFVYQSSTPQQRQQLLKQAANTPFAQAVSGLPTNAPVQNQTPGNSFGTNLTNYALHGGVAGTIYNNAVVPVANTIGQIPGSAYHGAAALGIAGQSFLEGQHGAQLAASKQAALNQMRQTMFKPAFAPTVNQNNATGVAGQIGQIAGITGQNVLNVAGLDAGGGAVANLAENGVRRAAVKGGLTGAGFGAGYGLANSAASNNWDPASVATQVGGNALLGGGLGLGLGAVGHITAPAIGGVNQAVHSATQTILDKYNTGLGERGSIPLGQPRDEAGRFDVKTPQEIANLYGPTYKPRQVDRNSVASVVSNLNSLKDEIDVRSHAFSQALDTVRGNKAATQRIFDTDGKYIDQLEAERDQLETRRQQLSKGVGKPVQSTPAPAKPKISLAKRIFNVVTDSNAPWRREDGSVPIDPSQAFKGDPQAALKQEALKYKSADEFVKAQAKGKTPIFTEAQQGAHGSYTGTGADFEKGTGTINVGKYGDNTTLIHEVAHQRYEALSQEHQGALDYALKEFNDKNPGAFSTTNDPAENIALAAEDYLGNKRTYGSKFTNELNKTTNGRLLQHFFKQNADAAANGTTKIPYSKQQLTDLYNQAHAEAGKVAQAPLGDVPTEPVKADPLHLNEPTPKQQITDLTDTKVVGNAIGKTKAYVKRIDSALKDDPTNTDLRNRRVQLSQDLKELQSSYHQPQTEVPLSKAYQAAFKSPEELARDGERPPLTKAQRQQMLKLESQQTRNKVDMRVDEGNVKGAIAKATGVAQEADQRLLEAQQAGRKLSDQSRKLLYRVEDGENVATVAKAIKDPKEREAFTKVASKLEDAFDYNLAALRGAGSPTLKLQNYIIPHYYEATKAKMEELGINPDDQVTFGRKTGFHDKSAKYPSYAVAAKHGLKPLYDNPLDAVNQYRQGASSFIRNNGLYAALKSAAPGEVADLGTVSDNAGTRYTQAAGRLPFVASDRVNDALANFRSTRIANPYLNIGYQAARSVNGLQKALLFFGAPFHYMNITKNFLGLTTTTGHELLAGSGVKNALQSSLVPGGYRRVVESARNDGTLAYARESLGMDLGHNAASYREDTVTGHVQSGLDKLNLFGVTHRQMNNFIDAYGITLARAAKKYGVEPGSAEAISLGNEYNMVLGRINGAVNGHNPWLQRFISDGALAPQYLRSQLTLGGHSVAKSVIPGQIEGNRGLGIYNAGDVARTTVVGSRVVEAAVAITASALVAGQLPTMQQAMNEAGLNPNNPNPNIDLHHQNASGHNQVMNLPTDIAGLNASLVTDPLHFGQARTSPTLSFAQRLATNTDWNGNQIVDKNQPGWQMKLLAGAAMGNLPIGAQNLLGATSGKLTPTQAVGQEFGGRVKTDPNDPQVIQAKQHFDAMDKAKASLGQNDQAVWNAINPQTKMADGSYTEAANWNAFKDPTKVYALLSHPNVLNAMIKANQTQPSHDPMWDLPVTAPNGQPSLTTFLTHEGIQGTDYGAATAKEIAAENPWITDLNTARGTYFNTLPKSQNPNATNPLQYPVLSQNVQDLMDLQKQLSAIPSAERTPDQTAQLNWLYANPDLTNAYSQLSQYTAGRRAQENVPQFAQAPVATPYVQAQMNNKNWYDPQVQNYLNASTAFKMGGPFGDGIAGAGGDRNTPINTITNAELGLNASGKSSYGSKGPKASALARGMRNATKEAKYQLQKSKRELAYEQRKNKPKKAYSAKIPTNTPLLAAFRAKKAKKPSSMAQIARLETSRRTA